MGTIAYTCFVLEWTSSCEQTSEHASCKPSRTQWLHPTRSHRTCARRDSASSSCRRCRCAYSCSSVKYNEHTTTQRTTRSIQRTAAVETRLQRLVQVRLGERADGRRRPRAERHRENHPLVEEAPHARVPSSHRRAELITRWLWRTVRRPGATSAGHFDTQSVRRSSLGGSVPEGACQRGGGGYDCRPRPSMIWPSTSIQK